jgi:MoaA/NifB/PqqE/SkfB family radical SAM enzyme
MFVALKPRRVNITLYGGSQEMYNNLCHNRLGYDRCINSLHQLKDNGIDVKLNVSMVEKNKSDYDQIISVAKDLDIPAEVNSYMFPALRMECDGCRDVDRERLSPQEAGEINQKYMKYKKGLLYKDYVHGSLAAISNYPTSSDGTHLDCRAGHSSVWINWRHIMTPCVLMENPAVDLKTTAVKDAWSEVVDKCRQLPVHAECAGCKLSPICQVCYAAANFEKKVRGNLDYLCEMSRTEKEIFEKNK